MLDYTRAIFTKTQKDLDTALTSYNFVTQVIYIAYLVYLMFTPNPIWYLHLALLVISSAFFVFDIVTKNGLNAIKRESFTSQEKRVHKEKLTRAKKRRSEVKKIKFYASHVIKLFVLASALYPIIALPDTVHPFSVMCTTIMILLWVLQVVLEVLKVVLEGRGEMFVEALRADVEFFTKPVNSVKNTFKKMIGKEVEEAADPSKSRLYLDKLVETAREEKKEKKAAARAEFNDKVSSWLDRQISKLPFKHKDGESTDLDTTNAIEVDEYTEEV